MLVACSALLGVDPPRARAPDAARGEDGASPLTCATDDVACGSTCTDLLTDPSHCGACDHVCGVGECRGGRCWPVAVVMEAGVLFGISAREGSLTWVGQRGAAPVLLGQATDSSPCLAGREDCSRVLRTPEGEPLFGSVHASGALLTSALSLWVTTNLGVLRGARPSLSNLTWVSRQSFDGAIWGQDELIFWLADGSFYGLRTGAGSVSQLLDGAPGVRILAAAATSDYLYASLLDGDLAQVFRHRFKAQPKTIRDGSLLFSRSHGAAAFALAVQGDRLFLSTDDGAVLAIDTSCQDSSGCSVTLAEGLREGRTRMVVDERFAYVVSDTTLYRVPLDGRCKGQECAWWTIAELGALSSRAGPSLLARLARGLDHPRPGGLWGPPRCPTAPSGFLGGGCRRCCVPRSAAMRRQPAALRRDLRGCGILRRTLRPLRSPLRRPVHCRSVRPGGDRH